MSKKYPIEVSEKRVVKRITIQQSFTDFLDAFNIERGLIYSLKMLFISPGQLIRSYFSEGRYRIVNSFRLLIITTAISLVIFNLTGSMQLFYDVKGDDQVETQRLTELMDQIASDWYNLILWMSIPVYALFSFLLFRKYQAFNYAEHVVINSFYISVSNILSTLLLPFGFLIGFREAFGIAYLLGLVYYFYLFSDLLHIRRLGFFLRTFLCIFVSNIVYFILLMIGLSLLMLKFYNT